ncbi:carbohydrate ABC transporter permease [Arenibacterium sp. LLYu02]|uniref:carbohydrate ABC transporter permease n=1 Tax=Arenibacterium sp. LLYu02 TaxID=3404132 RepID=UPI003B218187
MQKDFSSIVSPDAPEEERNWWVHAILGLASAIASLPVIWILLTAFMPSDIAQSMPPKVLFWPTLDAFHELIVERDMLYFMMNSAIVAIVSTVLSVVLGMFCAYALARYDFAGKDDVAFWILTNRMMPAVAIVLPMFLIFQTVNLLDTRVGLIILYTAMQLPFVVWMLKGYFEEVPRQLEEIALVDGDTWFGAFRKVVLPMMAPAITATAIFVLILSWNEYAFAFFLTGSEAKTLPPAVVTFAVNAEVSWDVLGAACLIITAPIMIFVVAVQKRFISGLSMGMVR